MFFVTCLCVDYLAPAIIMCKVSFPFKNHFGGIHSKCNLKLMDSKTRRVKYIHVYVSGGPNMILLKRNNLYASLLWLTLDFATY
jgi:hypothetical protein